MADIKVSAKVVTAPYHNLGNHFLRFDELQALSSGHLDNLFGNLGVSPLGRTLLAAADAAAGRQALGSTAVGDALFTAADAAAARAGLGAFGRDPILLTSTDNLDNITETGLYFWNASVPSGVPAQFSPAEWGCMLHVQHPQIAANARQDIAFWGGDNEGRQCVRVKSAGAWTPWFEVLTSDSIVGTGKIIERGSNANGEYTRFADGTQICWRAYEATVGVTNPIGSLYWGAVSWTFPVAFSSGATVTGSASRSGHLSFLKTPDDAVGTNTTGNMYVCSVVSENNSFHIHVVAIGRWF